MYIHIHKHIYMYVYQDLTREYTVNIKAITTTISSKYIKQTNSVYLYIYIQYVNK